MVNGSNNANWEFVTSRCVSYVRTDRTETRFGSAMTKEPSPSLHFSAAAMGQPVVPADRGSADTATATSTRKSLAQKAQEDNPSVDEQLVGETKVQIRALVQEIAELSREDIDSDSYFSSFLAKTTAALASIGGAIWLADDESTSFTLKHQVNLKATGLVDDPEAQTSHHKLLSATFEQGETIVVPPGSMSNEAVGNPTDCLLIIAPLKISRTVVGLVEIFQRTGAGPKTQRGYLRFVRQMADMAGEFLASQRIQEFAIQRKIWQRLEQFIRLVHQGLDLKQTAYTLANEGRRLIECDRVSVALGSRKCTVQAVSGLDTIERRAEQVRKLSSLASACLRAGQPIWYDGQAEQLPPQIESRLQDYVDLSHATMLAIVPLFESDPSAESAENALTQRKLGVLIVEQLSDAEITPTLRYKTQIVAEHGQAALTNSQEHDRIFLMPVWKRLGKLVSLLDPENRWKSLAVVGLIAGVIAFLTLFPYSFGLSANGRLVPETKFEVFAQADGVVKTVFVTDTGDTIVRQGETLGSMKNSDLELEITNLEGKIAEAKTNIDSAQQRWSASDLDRDEKFEISSQISQNQQVVTSLSKELEIRKQDLALLQIQSPAAGRVVTWNARQNLLNRPVKIGQNLMTIVPPETTWQLEIQLPEKRLNHLLLAQQSQQTPLKVSFGLLSNPGVEFEGTVLSVDSKLDVYSDDGNAALVRVAFDNGQIDPELLLTDTRVTAKIHCGERSIGYVIFHELIETVQSKLVFWF